MVIFIENITTKLSKVLSGKPIRIELAKDYIRYQNQSVCKDYEDEHDKIGREVQYDCNAVILKEHIRYYDYSYENNREAYRFLINADADTNIVVWFSEKKKMMEVFEKFEAWILEK